MIAGGVGSNWWWEERVIAGGLVAIDGGREVLDGTACILGCSSSS